MAVLLRMEWWPMCLWRNTESSDDEQSLAERIAFAQHRWTYAESTASTPLGRYDGMHCGQSGFLAPYLIAIGAATMASCRYLLRSPNYGK